MEFTWNWPTDSTSLICYTIAIIIGLVVGVIFGIKG